MQQQGRLERLLGARQVVLLGAVDEVLELAHDGKRGVVETFEVVAGHVHAEQTGIGVVGVESHEGVTELVGGEDLRELGHHVAGADGVLVPAANHGLHQHERHGVRRGPGRALERHGEAARRHVVVTNANFATRKVTRVLRHQRLGARALRREAGERLFGELDEVIVVHRTGTDENHSRGGVVRLDVRLQVFLRHGPHARVRTENRRSERRLLKRRRVQVIEDHFFHVLLHLFHLAKDHTSTR